MKATTSIQDVTKLLRPLVLIGMDPEKGKWGDAQHLHTYLIEQFKELTAKLSSLGYSSQNVENIQYGLAAFLDEKILASSYDIEWFQYSVVKSLFQDSSAGEHFYDRFERIISRPDLAVSVHCYKYFLLLGFRGKYLLEGDTEYKGFLRKYPDVFSEGPSNTSMCFITQDAAMAKQKSGARFYFILAASFFAVSVFVYGILAYIAQLG